jgi:hypothetical protein
MFSTTSRYYGIETAVLKTAEGKEIAYTRRRFLPPAEKKLVIAEHTVTQDERLDNITANYLVDPEQFWRLCDANNAMRPEELTEVIGCRLIIPLPQGGQ